MFIAMNRFQIAQGFEEDFEERWRERDSLLNEATGFMRVRLLRSRLPVELKGTEYVSYTEWRTQRDFEDWLEGDLSRKAHARSQAETQGMYMSPPEFRGYSTVLEEGYGHRTDFRSPLMDHTVEST